ncbi:odorant receptor 230 isoform X2 [Nasonia vitripennis]|uniref:Odorant receptor n=1 Tax=Nasonia vitripennis TaxID=7425 RepID=A0A7M7T6E5_NASVI|nr:odorant receptor 230 isoform X2 [Nasonia vitripennis]
MEREPIKYEDISRLYYRLFRTMGILPSSSSRRTTLLRVYFHVTIVLYYSMSMFDGLRMLGHNDIEIEYVFEEVVIHGICARFLILSCRREELAELLLSCEKLWRMLKPGEDRVVKSYEKIARYLAHYITWTTLVAIFFYIVAARIVKLPPAEVNGTERRMLPFRFYVDVQRQPWYDIVTVLEIVVVLNIAMIVSTIETTGPFLITMACGYLRSIRNRLLAIADEAEGRGEISRLSTIRVVSCVKFHQKIMRSQLLPGHREAHEQRAPRPGRVHGLQHLARRIQDTEERPQRRQVRAVTTLEPAAVVHCSVDSRASSQRDNGFSAEQGDS